MWVVLDLRVTALGLGPSMSLTYSGYDRMQIRLFRPVGWIDLDWQRECDKGIASFMVQSDHVVGSDDGA